MMYVILILVALLVGMGIAVYFQMKASQKQQVEQQQLLADYQQRIDEQEKLVSDYRALEKNFNNVGEGYEQALLAFDKLEEENRQAKTTNEALQSRCTALDQQLSSLQQSVGRSQKVLTQVLGDMRKMAKANNDRKLEGLIGRITDMDDVEGLQPVERTDNVLISQIAGEAIGVSGIDKVTYLKFDFQIAPDAAATMISTNLLKAVRALTHLLDNALKFTTEGAVTLRATVDMDRMVALYTVEDSGTGIAPDDAERIFEPYVKLNQYFDGQGVGLTVARNNARRMGGDVTLDATYAGPGARFVLTLPI